MIQGKDPITDKLIYKGRPLADYRHYDKLPVIGPLIFNVGNSLIG